MKPSKPSKSEAPKDPEKDPMVWDPPTPKISNDNKAKKSNWGNKPKAQPASRPVGREARNAYKPPGDIRGYNPIDKGAIPSAAPGGGGNAKPRDRNYDKPWL